MSHTSATHCGWRYGQHTPTPKVPAGLTRSELVAAALLHDTVEKSPHFLDELSVAVPKSVLLPLVLTPDLPIEGRAGPPSWLPAEPESQADTARDPPYTAST